VETLTYRHHDKSPTYRGKHSPCSRIVLSHCHNAIDQPQIQSISNSRLCKGQNIRSRQCLQARKTRSDWLVLICRNPLLIRPESDQAEVCKTEDCRSHITRQLSDSLHIDGRCEAANMDLGDDQEIKNDVDQELDCRDDQRHIRFIESSGTGRNSCFDGGRQSRECRDSNVCQRSCSYIDRDKAACKLFSCAHERNRHDQSEDTLEDDQSDRKTVSGRDGSVCSVSDDQSGCSWKALVENFGDYSDIGVDIGSHDHGRIDVGNPKFAECSVESR
jgi:hypothetical protein